MESADDAHRIAITALATDILVAGVAVYDAIRKELENPKIDEVDYMDFGAEFMCYILHLFDRNLSSVTDEDSRSSLMDALCLAACREQHRFLEESGFQVSQEQVRGVLGTLYTTRQVEYGGFKEDWFAKVALRFGENVCAAVEIPADKRGRVTLFCTQLGPEILKELLPALRKLARGRNT